MSDDRPILVVHAGDLHSGSEVALCAPGVRILSGSIYTLNIAQRWIWDRWVEFWDAARALRDEHNARLWISWGGEFVEGIHHGTTQLVSPKKGDQRRIALANLAPALDLSPERMLAVAGTEAHAGSAAETDEAIADEIGCEPDPRTGSHVWWRLRFRAHQTVTDVAHHAWGAYRPWTKGGNALRMAAALMHEYYDRPPEERPKLAVRHHIHTWNDSFDAHPIRVITQGAWKLSDAFIHRIRPTGSEPAVGGLGVLHWSDGRMEVHKLKFSPDPDPILEAA